MKLLGMIVVFLYILHAGANTINDIVKKSGDRDIQVEQLRKSLQH